MGTSYGPVAKSMERSGETRAFLGEAAAALGVSERTLWEWTQRGDVPHVRRGKTILYPVDTLRRWLDEQAKAKAAAERGEHE